MPLRSAPVATHGAVMLDSNTVRFALRAANARSANACLQSGLARPLASLLPPLTPELAHD